MNQTQQRMLAELIATFAEVTWQDGFLVGMRVAVLGRSESVE